MRLVLSLMMLGLLVVPSQARMNVIGYPLPDLLALESFTVVDDQLEWEGPDSPELLRHLAARFWWYADLWQQHYPAEPIEAFTLYEWYRWDPAGLRVRVTTIDLPTRSMQCAIQGRISVQAVEVLTVLGCLWGVS